MGVFERVARPAIMAASRSGGMRRAAERLPVTRHVVHRFVPGETVADALESVGQLRDSNRLVSIDYLGEDVTDVDAANATVDAYLALLDALDRAWGACGGRATARGVAEAVGAGAGVAPRRREDRAGERPHHLRAGATRRRVGDRGRRGSHDDRLDAVHRA